MSYSRWGSPGLGWYIYRTADPKNTLFVSPGCPGDAHSLSEHLKQGNCSYAEYLSKGRVEKLRDILNEALEEWDL